ncbi:MAG: beta-lactamase family protein, partial [Acidobacteriia bacterium]|nr:beta-lactamase family protein [Terriglobia bacterium]
MMRKRFLARFLLLILCSASLLATAEKKKPAKPAAGPLGDFDAYVQRTMQEWKVPGAAIAIVKDGKVVLSKCYGLRDVRNNLPVTDQTLFPIASITKSFTVATLGTFASEGKLDWDKPV